MSNALTVFPAALSDSEAKINAHQDVLVANVGVPYEVATYEFLIRKSLQKSIDGLLEAGALLAVAKACAPHGEWQRMLEKISLSRSYALKLIDVHEKHQSLSKEGQKRLAALKPSVIFECVASLSDEQFEELVEEGETSGLKHEDLLKMSFRKAREALRKSEEEKESLKLDLEASRALARNKSEANQKLQQELDRARRVAREMTPDESLAELARDVADVANLVSKYLLDEAVPGERVNSMIDRGRAQIARGDEVGICQRLAVAGVFDQLELSLRKARARLELPVYDPKKGEAVDPVLDAKNWLPEADAKAADGQVR